MKILVLWILFFVFFFGSVELWSSFKLRSPERSKDVLSVEELKNLYPSGIYPVAPSEIPENKRFHEPRGPGIITKHEHHFLNTPEFHKDSHRYIIRDESGEILSDVNFYFDQYRRRLTPANDSKKARTFVALLGDSNIVGYGLPQEETLSNYLSLKLPKTRVYNYARPGMYPYEIMELTEKMNPSEEIPEKNGILLYFFHSYHLLRNMGAFREISQSYSHHKKVVNLDESGEVIIGQTYQEEMPVWTSVAPLLRRSAAIQYFSQKIRPGESDYKIETAIIRKMQKNAEKKGMKFYVVIHPFQPAIKDTIELLEYLSKAGLPFIYFGHWKMEKYTEGPVTLGFDKHVSKHVNRILADGLSQVLLNELSVVK